MNALKKIFLFTFLINVCCAVEVFDKPEANANLLIIGDVAKLQLLNDNYIHVYDPSTKVSGYVKYDDYQKARINADIKKQYPQLSSALGQEEQFKDKAALFTQNIKNKQAQLTDIKKRMQMR